MPVSKLPCWLTGVSNVLCGTPRPPPAGSLFVADKRAANASGCLSGCGGGNGCGGAGAFGRLEHID